MTQGSKTAKRADFDKVKSAILNYLERGKWETALLLAVPLFTGLRISEWRALTWAELLSDNIVVSIKKDRGTGKVRRIAFGDTARAIFRQCWLLSGYMNQQMLVFKTPYRSKRRLPYSVMHLNSQIQQICQDQKWPHYTSHSFRKSWGYKMYTELGASQEALLLLQRAFNHNNTQTTIIYLGLADDQIEMAMRAL